MKIQLNKHYRNINGVSLSPGVHDLDTTLAKYLIENGHATAAAEEQHDPAPDYAALSMDHLRGMLGQYGMTEADIVSDPDAHWKTRQAEIVAWLEQQ